jgi:hypothetical protein
MMDARRTYNGAVWRCGGINGRPSKVNALIPDLKMGWWNMAVKTSGACAMVRVVGLLDRFVLLARYWVVW